MSVLAKKTPNAISSALIVVVMSLLSTVACGKKGPPLPPLVKLPVAPANLVAARRADTVDLQLTVPSVNTDNTRPANVARVEVYAFTGPAAVSEADVLKQGTRVANIVVKSPRDPNATFDPDDPEQSEADVEPPQGAGLEQGAIARVQETLTARPSPGGAPATSVVRTYIGVGVTAKGRRGPSSRRVAVPLVEPPPAPPHPNITYTEQAVTLTWLPVVAASSTTPSPTVTYNVYEVVGASQVSLTKAPLTESRYSDPRMTWGATRCYGVRSVEVVDALPVESEETTPACITLVDTFPPAAPTGLQAVATEGAINLIWDANTEADLAGYILSRAVAPGDMLTPITPAPIRETAFQDRVEPGVRYVYAVQAVDKAGNISPPSDRTEETAR